MTSAEAHPPGLVFVVDDDVAVGRAMGRVLTAAGYEAQVFASADAFLARPAANRPACVVLDQRMPGLSGLELQRAITGESSLAVVFLTGHADVPTSVEAMKAGAVDFLTKPK